MAFCSHAAVCPVLLYVTGQAGSPVLFALLIGHPTCARRSGVLFCPELKWSVGKVQGPT